jgi:hypothetical protein
VVAHTWNPRAGGLWVWGQLGLNNNNNNNNNNNLLFSSLVLSWMRGTKVTTWGRERKRERDGEILSIVVEKETPIYQFLNSELFMSGNLNKNTSSSYYPIVHTSANFWWIWNKYSDFSKDLEWEWGIIRNPQGTETSLLITHTPAHHQCSAALSAGTNSFRKKSRHCHKETFLLMGGKCYFPSGVW